MVRMIHFILCVYILSRPPKIPIACEVSPSGWVLLTACHHLLSLRTWRHPWPLCLLSFLGSGLGFLVVCVSPSSLIFLCPLPQPLFPLNGELVRELDPGYIFPISQHSGHNRQIQMEGQFIKQVSIS